MCAESYDGPCRRIDPGPRPDRSRAFPRAPQGRRTDSTSLESLGRDDPAETRAADAPKRTSGRSEKRKPSSRFARCVCAARGCLSPLYRVAPEEAFAVDEFEKLTSVTVFQARRALSVFRRRASRSLDPRLSRTLLVSVPRSCTRHSSPPRSSHFPVLFRGGVLGLLPIMLPNPPMSFLSAGFRIWKLHMRFSSTVIIAPALSNSPQ